MKRLLLDTHAFLWFVFDDARLGADTAAVIANPATQKLLSVASLWEIAVKLSLGKLALGTTLERFVATEIEGRDLVLLGIASSHLVRVAALPFHHRDPFDRLIIAQAAIEGLPIATSDSRFAPYGANVVW